MKNDERRTIVFLCFLGIVPVIWLALLIAPFLSGGLTEIVSQFPVAMGQPFQIALCEDSRKTVLVFLLIYGLTIGVVLSSRRNYRWGEEHGSARWGSASAVNRKYRAKEPEARDIALTMELYTSGSLDIFAHETNVDTKNRIISYDIHDLSEDLKQPGFVTITDAMINRVNANWAQGKKTHVIVDEFHIAYENEYSGNFFTSAWRQFRKRNASPVAITQNVDYLLSAPQARSMLSNSEFIVMLNQAENDQERLSELLNISPEQMRYVNGLEAGCGLLRYGNALIPFINRFPSNTELYKLITTRPGEGVFAKGQVDFDG